MNQMYEWVFFAIISKNLEHTGEEWIRLSRGLGYASVTALGAVDPGKEKDPGRGGASGVRGCRRGWYGGRDLGCGDLVAAVGRGVAPRGVRLG